MELSEIIEACRRGERLAQKMLYQEFSMKMRAVCYRYLGKNADAEDILQEGFITVFTKISQYSGKGSFEGWMKRIFINSSLRLLKNKQNSILSHGEEKIVQWEQKNVENPLSAGGTEKQQDLIRRMNFSKEELMELLQKLPEGYRVVFNLFAIEKHNHKEIAKILSISENTSRSQLNRARKHVQQKLYEISLKRALKEDNEQYKNLLRVVS
ncbi:MAG: sigma-70 family RNA polymerase sigma factor [Bacteroidetes bacterium]|nr:sigma-70 family RNA polymerase sigma factor [Bacteroidota bacterium]MBT6685551.1 sigma-70 family RNA polymerase sigma factor [Bacteroidota bacterium]MBT7142261.1 sigma-70 family RNA polymerase sigma factor [Bacteroidota bacterium]MBT7490145.1 sigma-70 family RNA polymerase sigma factor [Bacteroidota bacterium]